MIDKPQTKEACFPRNLNEYAQQMGIVEDPIMSMLKVEMIRLIKDGNLAYQEIVRKYEHIAMKQIERIQGEQAKAKAKFGLKLLLASIFSSCGHQFGFGYQIAQIIIEPGNIDELSKIQPLLNQTKAELDEYLAKEGRGKVWKLVENESAFYDPLTK